MKATGIVRRIDDLGRVVIPKEIRRTQRIREGDPLEIFISADGEVIFKKYSPVGELSTIASQCAEVLAKNLGLPVLICDREHVVAAAGPGRKEVTPRPMRAVAPILVQGDVTGAVVVLEGERASLPGQDGEEQQAVLTAGFLARQLES